MKRDESSEIDEHKQLSARADSRNKKSLHVHITPRGSLLVTL
jgi:hypothetical protein